MRLAVAMRPRARRAGLAALLFLIGCKGQDLMQPTAPAEPPAPETPATLLLGAATLESANGYHTAGSASLSSTDGEQTLRLEEDFETDRSSALDLRLCRLADCGDDDLILGSLQSFRGAQSYTVPGDGSTYDFVVIWCNAVDLAFGRGRLE